MRDKPQSAARASAKASMIGAATRIGRNPAIMAAEVDGEVVMMSVSQGLYFGLDDIASDVWKRLATPRTFSQLIEELAADYDASPEVIADDLRPLIGRMAEHKLVRLSR